MKWLEIAKTFDPALAERAQAALDDVQRLLDAFKVACEARDALAREVEAKVEAHRRVSTMPPGLDASELLPAFQFRAQPNTLYRAEWRRSRPVLAEVFAYTFDRYSMAWVPQSIGWDTRLHPTGVPKGKRKPVVTPERLAELCGGPCP